jgi:hypothetical protein
MLMRPTTDVSCWFGNRDMIWITDETQSCTRVVAQPNVHRVTVRADGHLAPGAKFDDCAPSPLIDVTAN